MAPTFGTTTSRARVEGEVRVKPSVHPTTLAALPARDNPSTTYHHPRLSRSTVYESCAVGHPTRRPAFDFDAAEIAKVQSYESCYGVLYDLLAREGRHTGHMAVSTGLFRAA